MQKEIRCNACGKIIKMENEILIEDVFEVKKEWGFFSEKDLETHQFCLCEECYDKIIEKFKIPVAITYKTEVI
jgi:hypothetical protein